MRYQDIQRLQRLGPSSLDHLPPYARDAAIAAILRVKELEESRLLRQGLYYIVLTDLSGATAASAALGAAQSKDRIQTFVQATIHALQDAPLVNSGLFLKDIGDASLFLFSAFQDVLSWHTELSEHLASLNSEFGDYQESDLWIMRKKTVVHLGEVSFSDDRDPVALAVNQVFKIEKTFGPDQLGCTDHVLAAIRPALRDAGIVPQQVGEQVLPGDEHGTKLWRLI